MYCLCQVLTQERALERDANGIVISRVPGSAVKVPALHTYMTAFTWIEDAVRGKTWAVCRIADTYTWNPTAKAAADADNRIVTLPWAEQQGLTTQNRNQINNALGTTDLTSRAVVGDTTQVVMRKIEVELGYNTADGFRM